MQIELHKHNLNAMRRLDGSLDPLKSFCKCGKFFEFNIYTGKTKEITENIILCKACAKADCQFTHLNF
jgi:hypothetical protein